jgi:serine protease inhibitor
MKRIVVAALALIFCALPAAQASQVDLLATLYAQRGQTVVSPLSVNLALAMAAEGAAGETRAQLLAAAGLTEEGLKSFADQARELESAGLVTANAAFIRQDFDALERYTALLSGRYAAEVFLLGDDDIHAEVNAWASEKTGGLIDALLDGPVDPTTVMLLVNALSLNAEWSAPFAGENTLEGAFFAPEGEVKVEYMRKTEGMEYAQLNGMRAVRLGYRDSSLGLIVVLPDESIAQALEELAARPVDWAGAFTRAEVALWLPKLSASDGISLAEALKALGVLDAFDEKRADFSGIDAKSGILLNAVEQKTRLDIDEAGTTAGAGTSIGFTTKSAPAGEPPIEFIVDRPYILLLCDDASGLMPFAAAIDRP